MNDNWPDIDDGPDHPDKRPEMAQESFTVGSQEMTEAMISKLPQKYEMELNKPDMSVIIYALHVYSEIVRSDELSEKVMSLYSSIAETLGIEGV